MQKVHDYAESQTLIKSASEKTGVPPEYILIGVIIVAIALLYNGFGGLFLILLFGFMYPLYVTFKALKYEKQELLVTCGKYWVVMGFGVTFHEVIEWIAPNFPLFFLLTVVAIILLIRGQFSSSVYIFDNIIMTSLSKLETNIDSALTSVQKNAEENKDLLGNLKSQVEEKVKKTVKETVAETVESVMKEGDGEVFG